VGRSAGLVQAALYADASLWLCAILLQATICLGEIHDESFIEGPAQGRQAASAIDEYAVEEEGDRVLKTFNTQEEE
jgi:hypothetical protein